MSYEEKILHAVREAQSQNMRVIKLGIPEQIQANIVASLIKSQGKPLPDKLPTIDELFGIPVEKTEILEITIEIL